MSIDCCKNSIGRIDTRQIIYIVDFKFDRFEPYP